MPTTPARPARFARLLVPVWLVTSIRDLMCASALSVFAYHTPAVCLSGAFGVAAIYGPFIWLGMSLVVIPLAAGRPPRFGVRGWVQVVAHVPFVTIPLVFSARRMLHTTASLPIPRRVEGVA